jgi:hypothetical protein
MRTERKKVASLEVDRPNHQPNAIQAFVQKSLGRLSWQVWAVLLVVVSGGIGFTATSLLLKLPKTPNCPRIFWPVASASMRLYCAQLEAEKLTLDGFLAAINLVEALSDNHPLRGEIDRNVEEWAVEILDLAEKEFHSGNLEAAIATARKIPANVKAYNVVEERIERWQSTWSEGEEIFAQVERQLRESHWNQAFREAIKLLDLDNQYWATSKYDEITQEIQLAQEESRKLDSAYVALRRGGVDNWLKAVEEAQKINPNSYAHTEAQKLIAQAKDKIVNYIESLVDNRNWQALLDVSDRLPESLALKEEVNDWQTIASAGSDAQIGTVESLESAIVTAQQIAISRPLYDVAQDLIARWKIEIEDVARLEKAREFAQTGTVNDLNSAIAQADTIPQENPRYQEAREEIDHWTRQVQTIEDQPILARAEEAAIGGTIPSLQEAISQASLISPNRALYREAQEKILQWRSIIEEQEDRPFLDQALTLANGKDYAAAIEAARQIRRGRALYGEARSNVRRWQGEIQAQKDFQEAVLIAEARTPDALIAAINVLRKIPSSSDVGIQSTQALNRWSYQLLTIAKDLANKASIQEAIELAKMIPDESNAYESARAQIRVWQQSLEPAPLPPVEPPSITETTYQDPATVNQ